MIVNEKQMHLIAEALGRKLQAGDVLVLTGELGAGKTTFTKGIGLGLDIHQMIKSPTYTIAREYQGRLPLYHLDVYRIGDDPDSIDLDEYLFNDGVTVIEWGNLLGQALPDVYLEIIFDYVADGRAIKLVAHGEQYKQYLN
ncbi:tRNA (adenosine(37)-N6)-threonylcarbamoyltransferase complex ATPase subunit type 1 TsaE [Lactococcus carnosus]|uniref:tRNA (adenosine(37)-N6)-threonylcarbamoyltransferase complex ATPase subunit type 1 TsaE n=1 Tax=Pseudolactococcus carnosus TaxID=2749961 RepID=UPI001FB8F7E6|nr:tRNA (adenosine(37)-N6)-threonylcarbamoyltransferase complex ATPase subunit type 1 TsaE [Lactococcus carnosus]MCJ1968457.1 tRNA (adenosine(37)-N6)-threonylcarbamoyltransferase complex ATPase subunit type 1 TsaE [Lactococcus carnosus]